MPGVVTLSDLRRHDRGARVAVMARRPARIETHAEVCNLRFAFILVSMLLASVFLGCSEESSAPGVRSADPAQLRRGAQIFAQNCAVCHGERAQGAENWRKRDAQGRFPPPPLNGTAHAWHHPYAQLRDIIENGTAAQGGNMPAWSETLSDAEIDAVIAWFQSLWPEEVYEAWVEIDNRARAAR